MQPPVPGPDPYPRKGLEVSISEQVERQYFEAVAAAERKFGEAVGGAWGLAPRDRWDAIRAAEERLALDLALTRERHLSGDR
jgi:hypothetical protein